MTDEEINDRVAREVMGWTLRECGDSLDWFNGDEYQCGRYDFSPATDARHAMEVATKCRLSLLINSDVDKPMWQARRWVTMRDETASEWCESPCRAICLAALAAKGGG